MKKLTNEMGYVQTGRPSNVFQPENCGPEAFSTAAYELIAGQHLTFVRAVFDEGKWGIDQVMRFGIPEGKRVIRWLGVGGDPLGVNSHTVTGSGSLDTEGGYNVTDGAFVTACLCRAMFSEGMVIRVREDQL